MTIKTKFDVGDKVYFRLHSNVFAVGEVENISVTVEDKDYNPFYMIKGKFNKKFRYFEEPNYSRKESRKENEVFKTKEEMVEFIADLYQEEIDSIKQDKTGWF